MSRSASILFVFVNITGLTSCVTTEERASAADGIDAHLTKISAAPTEKAAVSRVLDAAGWVKADPENRASLDNCVRVVDALRANKALEQPERVEDYFLRVDNVLPENCTTTAHATIDRRLRDMMALAESCGREAMVKDLGARRKLLAEQREQLDARGLCMAGNP